MERVPPDPMCFDCWLADDDANVRPKHLERDGASLVVDGKVNSPWRCAACAQHWLLVCDQETDSQTFQRCSR